MVALFLLHLDRNAVCSCARRGELGAEEKSARVVDALDLL